MAKSNSLPKYFIPGLRDLFRDHAGAEMGSDNFSPGSTIVLSGPPGAGKTTFALGLVRSMLLGKESHEDKPPLLPKHVVYYISTEVDRDRLKRMFGSRGWFDNDVLFEANLNSGSHCGFHVINPPQEIERPVKTSEELVNYLVRKISAHPSPKDGQFVFIIIDSITSLFKDSRSTGEARRQVHELVLRLREQFAKGEAAESGGLGFIMLLSEQGIENLNSPGMETYVADFVLKFGLRPLPMGVRLRTLEVTKSQGASMVMGEHTWSIVTNQSCPRLIAGDALREAIFREVAKGEGRERDEVRASSGNGSTQRPWGTIVVAMRPYFQPNPETRRFKFREDEPSGIRGLDQMLRFDPDYWFGNADDAAFTKYADDHTSIRSNSVTMLVGAPGTGKSTLCYHVIASHLARHEKGEALLVGFEQDLRESFDNFARKYPKRVEPVSRCSTIHRPRSGLSFNFLLLEIREWLNKNRTVPKRVAIDGISNLAATHSGHEFSQMLDAIISLFEEHPRQEGEGDPEGTSVFLTYESEQTEPVFSADTFRLPADNIVMLSHKVIEDDRRTAVTIIKSSHQDYDSMVRELVLDHDRPQNTHIHSGFDAYSGLLTGNLKRARVVLQLFQENEREKAFNEGAREYLNRLLPYRIELRDFSRFEIRASLDERGDQVKVPSGDVQVINMDEWWLAHKVQKLRGEAERARYTKQVIEDNNNKIRGVANALAPVDGSKAPEGTTAERDANSEVYTQAITRLEAEAAVARERLQELRTGHAAHDLIEVQKAIVEELEETATRIEDEKKRADAEKADAVEARRTWESEINAEHGPEAPFNASPEMLAWRGFRELVNANHLTKLESFVGTAENSPIAPGDFWCFEMEKGWYPDPGQKAGRTIGPYALPHYLDFGMLCVHVDVARAVLVENRGANEGGREVSAIDYPGWDSAEEVSWEAGSRGRGDYCRLLAKFLRPWCESAGNWFKKPSEHSAGTMVGLMHEYAPTHGVGGHAKAPAHGFAWDSRTPETAACFLYELAWAFGGDLGLFAPSRAADHHPPEEQMARNQQAVQRAICFIGYLVREKLMPPCPTLTDTAQSMFSRQYYSTFTDVNCRAAASHPMPERTHATQTRRSASSLRIQPTLLSLGFMPPGPMDWQTRASIEVDELNREIKLHERDAANERIKAQEEDSKSIDSQHSPNQADIDELKRWKSFRDRLRKSEGWDVALDSRKETSGETKDILRTGYGCCGAWMIGVKSPTAAPGIAQVLLQEIASLSFAKKRARMGAGFPARKDFYRHYGSRPVTGMEYLSWNEILEFLASKSRRRDRVYPLDGRVDPARMHKLIHHALTTIMEMAAKAPEPEEIIAKAEELTQGLFATAERMSQENRQP